MKLVIGNKNYSSWSLRPWLLMKNAQLDFEEVQETLCAQGIQDRFSQYSPSKRVPVLVDKELSVWDSLAICEYISENYMDGQGWPDDPAARAHARAVVCEMHASFSALRNELPMNCRAIRSVEETQACQKDIQRIDDIWANTPQRYDKQQPWLFGRFSIADCFYAPVALRFVTYQIALSDKAQAYANLLLANPWLQEWVAAGKAESEIIPEDEAGTDL